MRTCPACDQPLDDTDDDTCGSCGARVEGNTEAFQAVSDGPETALHAAEEALAAGGPALVVRKGPELGERFVIDRERLTIGRDPSSDIFLNDVTVSRDHASLTYGGGEVSVEDAGSLNGTYVNGIRVDRAPLADGDVVQVGTFQMVFMSGSQT